MDSTEKREGNALLTETYFLGTEGSLQTPAIE